MELREQDRREWIVRTLGALGFFAASPFAASKEHLHSAGAAPAADPDWKPSVLSAADNRSLVVLSDAIVPGATGAGCHRAIDLLLALEAEPARQKFRSAIDAFRKQAEAQFHKPLEQLSAPERAALLGHASASGSPLAASFKVLKQWTTDVYWSSQQGMRELGFKGRVAWATFPGCPHGGVHT